MRYCHSVPSVVFHCKLFTYSTLQHLYKISPNRSGTTAAQSITKPYKKMPNKKKIACQYGPTNTFLIATPIGDVEVTTCPKGLHSLQQVGDNDDMFSPNMSTKVSIISQVYQDNGYTYKPVVECVDWLRMYFTSPHSLLDSKKSPTICSSLVYSESFTNKVWLILRDNVMFGQTISYGGLAALCGNGRAYRAVGAAMKNNPLSLVVPCHRVIQYNGHIGNYHGGRKNKVKAWLLKHEEVTE